MDPSQKVAVLIPAAFVLTNTLTWLLLNTVDLPWPYPLTVVYWALPTAQVSLLAIWTALSRTRWLLRFPAAALGMLITCAAIESAEWELCVFISQSLLIIGTLGAAMLLGSVFYRCSDNADHAAPPDINNRKFRLSIAHTLMAITLLAVLFAVARPVVSALILPSGFISVYALFLTIGDSAKSAMIALVAVWAALGTGRPALRLPALGLFAMAAGCAYFAYPWLTQGHGPVFLGRDVLYLWMYVLNSILEAVLVAGVLLIFRRMGYRFTRPARAAVTY